MGEVGGLVSSTGQASALNSLSEATEKPRESRTSRRACPPQPSLPEASRHLRAK